MPTAIAQDSHAGAPVHEIADRGRRRIERHLAEARLPVGKTLASFEFDAVPMISRPCMLCSGPKSSAK